VNILGVTDPDGDPVTITIDGVTQDEPLVGEGSGNFCPDARVHNGRLQLRAERAGSGNGRVYEVAFTATDGRGGSCSGTITVCVPHDRSPGQGCVDDGQEVDSFGPCPPPKGQAIGPNQGTAMDEAEGVQFGAASAGAGQAIFAYALPEDGFVTLEVFDVSGRLVATVERGRQARGVHEVTWDAGGAARGVYYARFQAAGVSLTRSVLLLR